MADTETKSTDKLAEKVEDLSLKDGHKAEEANSDNTSPTVFKSIENFSVVHPLTYKWTLWYVRPALSNNEDWASLLKEVVTISTVEEFWGAYNNIPKVSELPVKADYAFFKSGITPQWEDVQNSKGGRWFYQYRKKPVNIDDVWLRILLGVIGGTLDNEEVDQEEINGIFVNVRRAGVKVNLWTKTSSLATVSNVGLRFKSLLDVGPKDEIEFTPHESTAVKSKVLI